MIKNIEKAINFILEQAIKSSNNSDDTLKYTQAVLNLSNSLYNVYQQEYLINNKDKFQ